MSKDIRLEILVSTMRRKNADMLLEKMNIKTKALIINQSEEKIEFYSKNNKRMITINEIGLSKSRNRALDNAEGDVCILSDDDLIYIDDVEEKIIEAFNENPTYDILAFQVEGIDRKFKKYNSKEKNINYISSMKISSVEIAFRRKSIIDNKIKFNEELGSGARYSMGEENEFLFKCLKKGLKIKYVPVKIADLYVGNSTWFKGFNKKYFYDKGAVFTVMSKKMSLILILQFAIRKYKVYREYIGMRKAVIYMWEGRKNLLMRNNR